MSEPNDDSGELPTPPSSSSSSSTSSSREDGGASADASAKPAAESAKAAPDPVAEAKAEAQRFKDQWMRSAADFDNFRKRSRKEVEDSRKAGREDLLKDLLPVFDNLERAITSAERATDVKPVSEGLKLVLRQFVDTIGRSGITKVPAVGHMFDPSLHEAIQQVETDDAAAGTIVAEVQPGYLQGERLVRAAMVVVAKPKADGSVSNGTTEPV